jgi:hypothetical protein
VSPPAVYRLTFQGSGISCRDLNCASGLLVENSRRVPILANGGTGLIPAGQPEVVFIKNPKWTLCLL